VSARDISFLEVGSIGTADTSAPPTAPLGPLHDARDQFEREYILRALSAQQGNISRTAEMLGIERSNLYRKMRGFGIAPPRRAEDEELA
jgi:two-component system nitrogen regulation response regulator NtrX